MDAKISNTTTGNSLLRLYFGIGAVVVLSVLVVLLFVFSRKNPSSFELLAFYILVGFIGGLLFFLVDPLRDQTFKWKGIINLGGSAGIGMSLMFLASVLTPQSQVLDFDILKGSVHELETRINNKFGDTIKFKVSAGQIVIYVTEYSLLEKKQIQKRLKALADPEFDTTVVFSPRTFEVVLMDSKLKELRYNSKIGPNAEILEPLLKNLRYLDFSSESTDLGWDNYQKIFEDEPDLIIMHASCFLRHTRQPAAIESHDPRNPLLAFLKFMVPTKTKFLIYSREVDGEQKEAKQFEMLIPKLRGRIKVFHARDHFQKIGELMAFTNEVKNMLQLP